MYWLEFDPDVISYNAPAITVDYRSSGREKSHTSDFQVVRRQKKQIIEVKSQKTVETEKYDRLYQMLSGLYDDTGWAFVVLTEAEIRREPILSNIKLLYRTHLRSSSGEGRFVRYRLIKSISASINPPLQIHAVCVRSKL